MQLFGCLPVLYFFLENKYFPLLLCANPLKFFLLRESAFEFAELFPHLFQFILPEFAGEFHVDAAQGGRICNLFEIV